MSLIKRLEKFKDDGVAVSVKVIGANEVFNGNIRNLGDDYFSVTDGKVIKLFVLSNVIYVEVKV